MLTPKARARAAGVVVLLSLPLGPICEAMSKFDRGRQPGLEWLIKLLGSHCLAGYNESEMPSVSELRTLYKFTHSTTYLNHLEV